RKVHASISIWWPMAVQVIADPELIRKYGKSATAYTCYPAAERFAASVDDTHYCEWLKARNKDALARPLALYVRRPTGNTPDAQASIAFYIAQEMKLIAQHVQDRRRTNQVQWTGRWSALGGDMSLDELVRDAAAIFDLQRD